MAILKIAVYFNLFASKLTSLFYFSQVPNSFLESSLAFNGDATEQVSYRFPWLWMFYVECYAYNIMTCHKSCLSCHMQPNHFDLATNPSSIHIRLSSSSVFSQGKKGKEKKKCNATGIPTRIASEWNASLFFLDGNNNGTEQENFA